MNRDILGANLSGLRSIWIDRSKEGSTLADYPDIKIDKTVDNIEQVTEKVREMITQK